MPWAARLLVKITEKHHSLIGQISLELFLSLEHVSCLSWLDLLALGEIKKIGGFWGVYIKV